MESGSIRPTSLIDVLIWRYFLVFSMSFDTGREGGSPELHNLIFDGLTFYNWDTKVTEPVLATSWEYDAATLTYLFHLRDDIKWTNGSRVTAADFEWTWKRNLSPELASANVSFLGYIKNGNAYNAGKATADSVGVTAVDDVITIEDHGIWTDPGSTVPPFFFSFPAGTLQATRQQANAKTGPV